MKITFDDTYEFVPAWNGNKADAEPITFKLRYLTSPERSRCIQKDIIVVDGEKTQIKVNYREREMFELSVEKITGLDANGKKVETAKDFLAEKRLSGLFDEVVNEIVARNTRQDLKN